MIEEEQLAARSNQDWLHLLSDSDVAELNNAVEVSKKFDRPLIELRLPDFPLPTLGAKLKRITETLEFDRGFAVVRGIPVDTRTEADVRRLYWGIGLHIGVALAQKSSGQLIVDVRDQGEHSSDLRRHDSSKEINFHVDSCDVVALLCRRTAHSGGASLLTNSLLVRDEIARLRPDLLELLEAPLPFASVGPQGTHDSPFFLCPVFGTDRAQFTSRFYGARILATQTMPGAPTLTPEQIEAVELVNKIAADPALVCETDFQPGDLQLVNNHIVYHARTAFADHSDADDKRHLLRLWLSVPGSRPLPDSFAAAWGSVAAGTVRGGVPAWQLRDGETGRYQRDHAKALGMRA